MAEDQYKADFPKKIFMGTEHDIIPMFDLGSQGGDCDAEERVLGCNAV
jgi:hypothetical protein